MAKDYVHALADAFAPHNPDLERSDLEQVARQALEDIVQAAQEGGRPATLKQHPDGSIDVSYLSVEPKKDTSPTGRIRSIRPFRRR